jgi:hypothetical protein
MTDDQERFDVGLAERLSAAERRVDVAAGPPGALQAARRQVLSSVAAVAILGVLAAGILLTLRQPDGSVGGSPSPSASEEFSVQARDGDFTLTLSVPRTQWSLGEIVPVTSTLTYGGDDELTLCASGASAIFEVRQISGGSGFRFDVQHLPCVTVPISNEQPAVREFNVPDFGQAILTPGRWQITATSSFTIEGSEASSHQLLVRLEIEVSSESSAIPNPSVSSPSPANSPQSERPAALTRLAMFGMDGSLELSSDLTAWNRGFLAIGTHYEAPQMPNFGPAPPHEGRVWTSPDGMTWTDVTPQATFIDRQLRFILSADDGSLIVLGDRWDAALNNVTNYAWRSVDGITWHPLELSGLPNSDYIQQVAQGAKGIVAAVGTSGGFEPSLWHSADGIHWTMTHEPRGQYPEESTGLADLQAGPEGFVALLGTVLYGGESDEPRSYVLVSGDGKSWIEAKAPDHAQRLTAVDRDWLIAAQQDITAPVFLWSSANGLSWREAGHFGLGVESIGEDRCFEYPDTLGSISSVVLLGSVLSYPCSEGAFVTAGAVRVGHLPGLDDWSTLTLADQSSLAAVIDTGDAAILAVNVGRQSTRAEFWILPDR